MSRQHLNAQAVFCCWKEKARKDGIICGMQGTINDDETVVGGGKGMILADLGTSLAVLLESVWVLAHKI